MEASKQTVVRGGLGLPMILFLIFLVLQLTGNIDWPWYAVAAPLLIAWGFGLFLILTFAVIAVLASRR